MPTPLLLALGLYGLCSVGSGLFKSANGGQTWRLTDLTCVFVGDLIIDPKNPTTLYAISKGVRKSTDGP